MIRFDCCALSEPAAKHTQNQDYYAIDTGLGVFAVADGMGGRPGGVEASRLAVEEIMLRFQSRGVSERNDTIFLLNAIRDAGRKIHEFAERNEMMAGMGTTLTAAIMSGNNCKIVHVGDSRAYLFRNSRLIQITTDHNVVSELMRKNLLTPEEAEQHPLRHVLSQVLGAQIGIDPDVHDLSLIPGDYLLMATDGLNRIMAPRELEDSIRTAGNTAEELCARIMGVIRQDELPDDTTVLVVKFTGDQIRSKEA